jgi:hypothetical protein
MTSEQTEFFLSLMAQLVEAQHQQVSELTYLREKVCEMAFSVDSMAGDINSISSRR